MISNLTDQLIRDEALALYPYTDSAGKITIGVGRNLSDDGISLSEAKQFLVSDIANAAAELEKNFPWVVGLDEVRHGALLNMTFNLGIGRLAKFEKFLAAMRSGDWAMAKREMLDSLWAAQVGGRAQRLAVQIETGNWQ